MVIANLESALGFLVEVSRRGALSTTRTSLKYSHISIPICLTAQSRRIAEILHCVQNDNLLRLSGARENKRGRHRKTTT